MELSKLEAFLKELQKSWKTAKLSMKRSKKVMKKQFNKKRQNLWKLKQDNNIWLEAKNIQLKQPSKKLDQNTMDPLRLQRKLDKKHSN